MKLPLLLLGLYCSLASAAIQCQNPNGEADWWFGYKMPGNADYAYADASASLAQAGSLDGTDNALYATLSQIYPLDQHDHIIYNDEPDNMASNNARGHTKGVLAWDGTSGFWLLHSIPKFPSTTDSSYSYPGPSSLDYGQSMLCISFKIKDLPAISRLLQYNSPQVDSSLITNAGAAGSLLNDLVNADFQSPGSSLQTNLKSIQGQTFSMFNKDASFGKDLYADLVQPALGIDMFVETWQRSPTLESYCRGNGHSYNTWNVKSMNVAGVAFKETQDHSKIAISTDSNSPYVCVGGINRMSSQFSRGGGTTCFQEQNLWAALRQSVVTYDNCGSIENAAMKEDDSTPEAGFIYVALAVAVTLLVGLAAFLMQKPEVAPNAFPEAAMEYQQMVDFQA